MSRPLYPLDKKKISSLIDTIATPYGSALNKDEKDALFQRKESAYEEIIRTGNTDIIAWVVSGYEDVDHGHRLLINWQFMQPRPNLSAAFALAGLYVAPEKFRLRPGGPQYQMNAALYVVIKYFAMSADVPEPRVREREPLRKWLLDVVKSRLGDADITREERRVWILLEKDIRAFPKVLDHTTGKPVLLPEEVTPKSGPPRKASFTRNGPANDGKNSTHQGNSATPDYKTEQDKDGEDRRVVKCSAPARDSRNSATSRNSSHDYIFVKTILVAALTSVIATFSTLFVARHRTRRKHTC